MKKFLVIAVTTLVLLAGVLPTAAQAVDVKGPKCGDINGGDPQSYYQVDATSTTLHEAILYLEITTAAPLCKNAQLTVFVSSDATTYTAYTYPGDNHFGSCGASCVSFTLDYGPTATSPSAAPPGVYVYLETAIGRNFADRAPDNGSAPFVLCDHDTTTTDYDSNGSVIPGCIGGGGNYFQ